MRRRRSAGPRPSHRGARRAGTRAARCGPRPSTRRGRRSRPRARRTTRRRQTSVRRAGWHAKSLDAQQRRRRCRRPCRTRERSPIAPVMRSTIHAESTSSRRRLTDDHAVAKDGHAVGDAQQLLQPMRDVDDRDAVRRQVADDLKRTAISAALSAEVGSSIIRTRTSRTSALAISTICCWPSGSVPTTGARIDRLDRACARTSRVASTSARSSSVAHACGRSRPTNRFSATVRSGKSWSSW